MKKNKRCTMCGGKIKMMIYRFTPYCCQLCEKNAKALEKTT